MVLYINYGIDGVDLQVFLRNLVDFTEIEELFPQPSGNPGEYALDLNGQTVVPIGSYHVEVQDISTGNPVLTGYITVEAERYRLFRSRDEIETETSNRPIAFSTREAKTKLN